MNTKHAFSTLLTVLITAVVVGVLSGVITYSYAVSKKDIEIKNLKERLSQAKEQTQVEPGSMGLETSETNNQQQATQTPSTATTDGTANWKTYTNEKYGYTIKYPEDLVEIVLNDVFERGTEGNPSFRIKSGGHFALGVYDNPNNLSAKEWLIKGDSSGAWETANFNKIIIGEKGAYSALITEPCYIEWIIIPRENKFYTFGAELCGNNYKSSLTPFKNIVSTFQFTK